MAFDYLKPTLSLLIVAGLAAGCASKKEREAKIAEYTPQKVVVTVMGTNHFQPTYACYGRFGIVGKDSTGVNVYYSPKLMGSAGICEVATLVDAKKSEKDTLTLLLAKINGKQSLVGVEAYGQHVEFGWH
jgi:hypothetical protein